MFDFYFGPKPTNLDEEVTFLTSVKRTLPRWCNSIPDAEFGAICEILHHVGAESDAAARPLVLVETGSGASTLALAYYAMKHAGVAYSWDMNGAKVSVIRTACTETFGAMFEAGVPRHLKAVAYHSLSPYAGLPILRDLTDHIDFAFHDSEHVSDTLTAELDLIMPLLSERAVVGIDDAYYAFKHTDTAYLNLVRQKLGLPPIPPIPGNDTDSLDVHTERRLRATWQTLEPLHGPYRERCQDDISVAYYGRELSLRSSLGMAQVKKLENRFFAWRVTGRKA